MGERYGGSDELEDIPHVKTGWAAEGEVPAGSERGASSLGSTRASWNRIASRCPVWGCVVRRAAQTMDLSRGEFEFEDTPYVGRQ
jgi:hypothetical protein